MTLLAYEPFQDRLTPGDTREVRFQPNDVASLAIDVQSLGALFRIFEEPPPFERDGDDAVLTVRGPLTHHAGWFDSYDSIRSRFDAAIASDAKRVVMRLDSPGGYVSGCFETARYIESKVKASGKKLVARIEGQATSAAYALACAADEIVATPTPPTVRPISLVTEFTVPPVWVNEPLPALPTTKRFELFHVPALIVTLPVEPELRAMFPIVLVRLPPLSTRLPCPLLPIHVSPAFDHVPPLRVPDPKAPA
jgi:hypothetical protein